MDYSDGLRATIVAATTWVQAKAGRRMCPHCMESFEQFEDLVFHVDMTHADDRPLL